MDLGAAEGYRSFVTTACSLRPLAFDSWLSGNIRMRDFRRLAVWEKSRELVLALYRTTKLFPREEMYGRCSASVAANIGSCRSQPVPERTGLPSTTQITKSWTRELWKCVESAPHYFGRSTLIDEGT